MTRITEIRQVNANWYTAHTESGKYAGSGTTFDEAWSNAESRGYECGDFTEGAPRPTRRVRIGPDKFTG